MAEEVNGDISLTEDNIQILSQGDLHTETCHLLALETSKAIVVEGSDIVVPKICLTVRYRLQEG